MKKYFSYLIAALMISVMLCGCGSMMNNTAGTASPAPTVVPAVPSVSPNIGSSTVPNQNNSTGSSTGSGSDNGIMNGISGMSEPSPNVTTSPAPTMSAK